MTYSMDIICIMISFMFSEVGERVSRNYKTKQHATYIQSYYNMSIMAMN